MIILRQKEYVHVENVPMKLRKSFLKERNEAAKKIRGQRRLLDKKVGNDPAIRRDYETGLPLIDTIKKRLDFTDVTKPKIKDELLK